MIRGILLPAIFECSGFCCLLYKLMKTDFCDKKNALFFKRALFDFMEEENYSPVTLTQTLEYNPKKEKTSLSTLATR